MMNEHDLARRIARRLQPRQLTPAEIAFCEQYGVKSKADFPGLLIIEKTLPDDITPDAVARMVGITPPGLIINLQG
jgi:hypothetical protein